MSLAEKLQLTPEDYLQGEASSEFKHEYLDGEVRAMVGASDAHVTIAGSLFFLLKKSLQGTPCRTYISDMKVNVATANAFFIPTFWSPATAGTGKTTCINNIRCLSPKCYRRRPKPSTGAENSAPIGNWKAFKPIG